MALFSGLGSDVFQHDAGNFLDLDPGELLEHNRLVQPVQELWSEVSVCAAAVAPFLSAGHYSSG
jgi:hypothetical protein